MRDGNHAAGQIRRGAVALGLAIALALAAGSAWALVGADTGAEWVQAGNRDKISLANILSREVGGDPWALYQCLDKLFGAAGANRQMTIQEGARLCAAEIK